MEHRANSIKCVLFFARCSNVLTNRILIRILIQRPDHRHSLCRNWQDSKADWLGRSVRRFCRQISGRAGIYHRSSKGDCRQSRSWRKYYSNTQTARLPWINIYSRLGNMARRLFRTRRTYYQGRSNRAGSLPRRRSKTDFCPRKRSKGR